MPHANPHYIMHSQIGDWDPASSVCMRKCSGHPPHDDHLQTPPSDGSSVPICSVKPSALLSFPLETVPISQGSPGGKHSLRPLASLPQALCVSALLQQAFSTAKPKSPSRISASRLKAATEASSAHRCLLILDPPCFAKFFK